MRITYMDMFAMDYANKRNKEVVASIHLVKKRFFAELDKVIIDTVDDCIDEDGNKMQSEYSADDIYNIMMNTDEFHFLTCKFVEQMIDVFMNDFETRMKILGEYGLR